MGLQLNPYDMCVSDKGINGKYCTIECYVDDNKFSHVEQDIIDDVISKVEDRFPVITLAKGNVNTFLGIKISYLKNRRIAINMKEYII